MTFLTDLYTYLTADAGLTALIGTRLYPNEAPQDPTLPYVIYYEFANPREQLLNCAIAVSKPRIQYSVYAETYAAAVGVADALKAAFQASSYLVIFEDERGTNDVTTSLARRDLDVRIVHDGV